MLAVCVLLRQKHHRSVEGTPRAVFLPLLFVSSTVWPIPANTTCIQSADKRVIVQYIIGRLRMKNIEVERRVTPFIGTSKLAAGVSTRFVNNSSFESLR